MINQKEFYRVEKKLIFLKDLRNINNEGIKILLDDLRNWKQLFREKIEAKQISQEKYDVLVVGGRKRNLRKDQKIRR